MRETVVERALVQAVRQKGGICWKWVCPSMTGVPDRICIFPGGRVVFVETKRPGLKDGRSEKQKLVHRWLGALGCTVLTLRNVKEVQNAVSTF